MTSDFARIWDNPPATFRSAPFWSWNGRLDPARLQRQIESMHRAGMGGFFMHSRYGLKTPYMGEEWFRCVQACVDKARQLGMKAYLYDEDRWPSGAAGGLVTRDHPEFRAVTLQARPGPAAPQGGKLVASFAIDLDAGGRLKSYRRLPAGSGEANLTFSQCLAAPSGWYNDGTYIDVFNPAATAEFIRLTHDAYASRFGKDFGDLIPAIFFDEPQYPPSQFHADGSADLPWSPPFAEQFRVRFGYDLLDHLPTLVRFEAACEFSPARYHFYRMCTELFVQNFTAQLGRWCAEHNIALTGHVMGEGDIFQTITVGACMPHYEHMQWPGIDVLTDQANELPSAKQAASVADQLGKPRVISELYGCTGWDWPLEGHKFVGDWHLATGVNLRCQHLSYYTLAGGGKRDYPASILDHSPWWPQYGAVEDYFARLGAALTQGRPVRDVLVLHTIENAWGTFGPGGWSNETICFVQSRFGRIGQTLSAQHYDWDFGDESLMARHARVEGDTLHVGLMSYKAVIVPPSYTMRASTLELLRKFQAGGGKLLFVSRVADRVDAAPSGAVAELAARCPASGELYHEIAAAVESLLPRRLSITEAGREQTCVWAMLRQVQGGQFLFVQSHDRRGVHDVHVRVRGPSPVVLWDAMSGERRQVPSRAAGEFVEFDLHLPPTGSALVSLGQAVPQAKPHVEPQNAARREAITGPFAIELAEPNTMPLDFCQYRFGDEPFGGPVPSLAAEAEIRKHFNVPAGGSQQPWYLYTTGVIDVAPRGRCQLRRTFNASHLPSRCLLALEQPENYRITVNGRPVASAPCGTWVDEDIATIDITPHVRLGENELLFDLDYRPDMELEDMYLVGDFGVGKILAANPREQLNYTLTPPVTQLQLGSWVGQGLDFYGGAVLYKMSIARPAAGRVGIELPNIACTAACVHVNGKRHPLPWAPFEADITDAMKPGLNEVIVEVVGGRKNILGPLHTPWTSWTGPGEFSPRHKDWTDRYLLNDHGLMSPVIVRT